VAQQDKREKWKYDGVRVVKGTELDTNTPQTPGMNRAAAITYARCGADKPGPAESALIGTPVADPERPVEILRTIHSLDPCIACAVHVIDPRNNKDYTIRVY